MEMNGIFKVRGTDILATDTPQQYHEKLARIALDEMYQFVAVLDAKGTLLEVNRAALEGGGLKLSDVEGKPFWECFWWGVSKETQETLRQAMGRASQGEFIRYDVEVYGRAHGKETIIIDFSMIPVKDESGNVVFIVPEGRDITEKKAYEQEIATKNKDLQALLERIRELDEIKTQFFANVSHELRTPLALIIGPADRLLKEDAEISFEQRRESARIIGRNARMLLKHVNDLLDISKLEAGKLKLEAHDTDIGSLVRFTASHFELLAQDRQIAFLVETPTQIISAIDPEKIQRVVMNLLSNAFKFVPDEGTVRASIGISENEVTISVEDSGPGVQPELRRAIFERFRQGEGGANRRFGGTGLGLAIAKEFVEMHKGAIEILDSNLGGACFRVTLPIYRLSQTTFAPTSPLPEQLDRVMVEGFVEELRTSPYRNAGESVPPISPGKPSVLVVEDNPEMNRFIAESLSEKYNVISAFDGQQGLEKALVSNPAIIVTDIMMPKVSGVQMIAEMRKHPELADVPILLLTAKADEDLKIKLLEESAQDFVAKPFSEKDLLVRVRNLIELKKSQERHRTLFKSMDEGFCTIEVIFNDNDTPVDYRFLEVNGAFEKQTGLKEAKGKRMRELAPRHEQHWYDIYGKIALTGDSARFENRAEALGRWYEVYAFRVGLPENRQVAIFFNDITARKEAEKALEEARRQLTITNERLLKTNEDLEQRVEKRTASLSEAIAQMEEFSYTISHDMRAPLRGMMAYSKVLLKDADIVNHCQLVQCLELLRLTAAVNRPQTKEEQSSDGKKNSAQGSDCK
jgi:PAS domain S-box-containing protein